LSQNAPAVLGIALGCIALVAVAAVATYQLFKPKRRSPFEHVLNSRVEEAPRNYGGGTWTYYEEPPPPQPWQAAPVRGSSLLPGALTPAVVPLPGSRAERDAFLRDTGCSFARFALDAERIFTLEELLAADERALRSLRLDHANERVLGNVLGRENAARAMHLAAGL
jgi:hypothetical protein